MRCGVTRVRVYSHCNVSNKIYLLSWVWHRSLPWFCYCIISTRNILLSVAHRVYFAGSFKQQSSSSSSSSSSYRMFIIHCPYGSWQVNWHTVPLQHHPQFLPTYLIISLLQIHENCIQLLILLNHFSANCLITKICFSHLLPLLNHYCKQLRDWEVWFECQDF